MSMAHWLALDQLQSRGSRADKAGSLGALHKTRQVTLGQFFTPAWIAAFAWRSLSAAFAMPARYSLLDNSIGAASLFRCADPLQFSLHGCDVDGDLVAQVVEVLETAGFDLNIQHAGMEQVELGRCSAALINPPFSLTLSSPTLTPYAGVTHYGKHGPDTSALSHEYALAQALAHCDVVAAIVPRSTTERLPSLGDSHRRLHAIYRLPSTSFRAENVAYVETDLLIFGQQSPTSAVVTRAIAPDDVATSLPELVCCSEDVLGAPRLRLMNLKMSVPAITLPPGHDKRVRLTKSGRMISLKFYCGVTQGRVMNALYQARVYSDQHHRYPAETKYLGQYKLCLDVIVLQVDPFGALNALAMLIENAGGVPIVTPELVAGLSDMMEEHRKMTAPYGRTVYRQGTPRFTATARRMALINRHQRGAVVAMGDEVVAERTPAGFSVKTARGVFECAHDDFFALFEASADAISEGYWEEIYPPIRQSYPQEIAALEARARDLGLDRWLTWDFQMEDLCELAFRPHGGICGWFMALGKSRLALALARLLDGVSLIVLRSRLVDEMAREMQVLGVNASEYQVIRGVADARRLKKINIISYELLKRPIDALTPKLTYAKLLKGHVTNVIADEGGVVANEHSLQTTALWQLSAKRRYIFDGTPFPNYVREALPLSAWCFGQARSYQPYSLRRGHIQQSLFDNVYCQTTGRQAFLDDFVCFDWATNEFLDSGRGAKREIPKINPLNLSRFRAWFAPQVKRRVQQEPAVRCHVSFPVPTLHPPIRVAWDVDHLEVYVTALEEFAEWYRQKIEDARTGVDTRSLNLALILLRLEACFKAANAPGTITGYAAPYTDLTSKERACVDLVAAEVGKGRRPMVLARNPSALLRLGLELEKRNISHLVFTGEETIKRRLARLNANIREGDTQVLLASLGVTQDGLNLPQINTFIFYNRSYKAREEFQAIYRMVRPQQKSDVYGYFLHLAGSIDEYMGQLMSWKTLSSESGLDYGEQPAADEFTHFDAFLQRFMDSLPDLKALVKDLRSQRVVLRRGYGG